MRGQQSLVAIRCEKPRALTGQSGGRWGVSAVRLRGKMLELKCCFWLGVTDVPAVAAKE